MLIQKTKSVLIIPVIAILTSCNQQSETDDSIIDPNYTKINTLYWSTSDLNNIRFRNGDSIFCAHNKETWEEYFFNSTPAYCYYNFDSTNNQKLYNSHALFDKRNIAPFGQRIALSEDWKKLVEFVGINNEHNLVVSKDSLYRSQKTTNQYRFNADLTGAVLNGIGTCGGKENISWWWCPISLDSVRYQPRTVMFNSSEDSVQFLNLNNDLGLKIRCIKE